MLVNELFGVMGVSGVAGKRRWREGWLRRLEQSGQLGRLGHWIHRWFWQKGEGCRDHGRRYDVAGMEHALKGFADCVVFEGDHPGDVLGVQWVREEAEGVEDEVTELGTFLLDLLSIGGSDERADSFAEPVDGGDAGGLRGDGARERRGGCREAVFDGEEDAFLVVFGVGNKEEGAVDGGDEREGVKRVGTDGDSEEFGEWTDQQDGGGGAMGKMGEAGKEGTLKLTVTEVRGVYDDEASGGELDGVFEQGEVVGEGERPLVGGC